MTIQIVTKDITTNSTSSTTLNIDTKEVIVNSTKKTDKR